MSIFIHFLNGDDLNIEDHYLQKGYRNDIFVEINTVFYEVYFFTQDSLEYEMRKDGFFSLPGMIILDVINKEKIIASVSYLLSIRYFDVFKGYDKAAILNDNFSRSWYTGQISEFTFQNSKSYGVGGNG